MLDNLSEYHKLSNDDTESRITANLGSFKYNPLDTQVDEILRAQFES